ncbi:hypothetical protein [Trinickia symbiotica]|uniref:hypothetical protein n=1 Tax=Trinickia symbiotica TaxID=863227 RepID=UPI0003A2C34E|nr:hypothetical protein [Trinickia symbiotica]
MGLTKRELALIAETHRNDYDVWVRKTESGFWKMEVHIGGKHRVYDIDTTRGETKGWRQLHDAIAFAQENCPNARAFFVEIGDWVLARQ